MDNNFIQYTGQIRNCYSVVGYGDVLCAGMGYTIENVLPVEHASAAMDNRSEEHTSELQSQR